MLEMEKKELSYTVGGNVRVLVIVIMENSMEGPLETQSLWPAPPQGIFSEKMNPKDNTHPMFTALFIAN